MTEKLLLRDAEERLQAAAVRVDEIPELDRLLAAWFSRKSPSASDLTAFSGDGPLRTAQSVAAAALAEVAGWPLEAPKLDDGLSWLRGVALARDGVPVAVATDAKMLLAFALAARTRPELAEWNRRADDTCPAGQSPAWLQGAAALIRGELSASTLPEVRVALEAMGAATTTEGDAEAVLARAFQGELPDDPLHAAMFLCALAWIRRSAPAAVPGRATTADVVRLLEGVERGMQEWTWEDAAKTKSGIARKWHVDHEYHVQNLLWTLLAPVFPDLRREEFGTSVGPVHPRVDLVIPSLRLIIEVKFFRSTRALKEVVNEIAEDASLYFAAGSTFEQLIAFVWDDGQRVEQHASVVAGLLQLPRVGGAVFISRPGKMQPESAIVSASGMPSAATAPVSGGAPPPSSSVVDESKKPTTT